MIGVIDAWMKWRQESQRFGAASRLSPEQQVMILAGAAVKAYRLRG